MFDVTVFRIGYHIPADLVFPLFPAIHPHQVYQVAPVITSIQLINSYNIKLQFLLHFYQVVLLIQAHQLDRDLRHFRGDPAVNEFKITSQLVWLQVINIA